VTRILYSVGFNSAAERYSMPIRAQARRFWAHHYTTMAPMFLPESELAEMGRQSEEILSGHLGRLREQWESVWLPEIQQQIAALRSVDLRTARLPELVAHMDDALERLGRLWTLHFEIVVVAYMAVSLFDEFYRELFDDGSAFVAYTLVQGFDNKTIEADRALYELSRSARRMPDVQGVIVGQPADAVVAALEQFPDGREFLSELRGFLTTYGERGSSLAVSSTPWIADPAPAIKNLKDYLTQPERDLEADHHALADEREARIAEARERLAAYPEAVRGQFEFLLNVGQFGNILTEEHNFYIDFQSTALMHQIFMAIGHRLVEAGSIETPRDIFHLTPDEIRETASHSIERRPLVAARKAEIERYRGMDLPLAVGSAPPGPPPANPVTTAIGKLFGNPPQAQENPDELHGAAGSPGVVRGRARIALALDDAASIQPGDILVSETTSPPWTPLFATVAAVVTNTGGILSHCAVVAREYAIPAVVGVGVATTLLNDGDLIEVDGNAGIIRVIERA
jgi:pyruvate,water dikinase